MQLCYGHAQRQPRDDDTTCSMDSSAATGDTAMPQIASIAASIKAAWIAAGNETLVPAGHIFYDRAEQPAQLAGFPYLMMWISQDSYEVRSQQSYIDAEAFVGYTIKIEAWTCQNMTGGASTGDQLLDQQAIQSALDAILTKVVPDAAWFSVPYLLHIIKEQTVSLVKHPILYLGRDVYTSTQTYHLLTLE